MKPHNIDTGDRVIVCMTRNDVFPWQTSPRFEAEYQYGPCGPGDMIWLVVEGVGAVKINGNCEAFAGLAAAQEE